MTIFRIERNWITNREQLLVIEFIRLKATKWNKMLENQSAAPFPEWKFLSSAQQYYGNPFTDSLICKINKVNFLRFITPSHYRQFPFIKL